MLCTSIFRYSGASAPQGTKYKAVLDKESYLVMSIKGVAWYRVTLNGWQTNTTRPFQDQWPKMNFRYTPSWKLKINRMSKLFTLTKGTNISHSEEFKLCVSFTTFKALPVKRNWINLTAWKSHYNPMRTLFSSKVNWCLKEKFLTEM